MNREEAIEALTRIKWVYVGNELFEAEKEQAIDIAIEALNREPSEDGTLKVKVEDATKIGRVLITDGKHRGGLYYPDEDEPKGDLISRQAAIEAIEIIDWYHQNSNKDMVHGANDDEHQAWYKAQDIYKALEAVPSADRPKGRWHYSDGKPATIGQSFGVICDQCGTESEYCTNFCGECGANMRGETE